jgi:hypothetical protein
MQRIKALLLCTGRRRAFCKLGLQSAVKFSRERGVIRAGRSEEVTSEQRLEGKGLFMRQTEGKTFQTEETASAKVLGWMSVVLAGSRGVPWREEEDRRTHRSLLVLCSRWMGAVQGCELGAW